MDVRNLNLFWKRVLGGCLKQMILNSIATWCSSGASAKYQMTHWTHSQTAIIELTFMTDIN